MNKIYDKYYETRNLFGEPYKVLLDFFKQQEKGIVLDLGCGQGRDAIPIAQLGFEVDAIDNSKIGIEQMNKIAKAKNINLNGIISDIYKFDQFEKYDFVLLDSMFHFAKKDKKKETEFIKKILANIRTNCKVIICIQDTGNKVEILNETINSTKSIKQISNERFKYIFEDSESGHISETDYRMIVIEK